MKRIRQYGILSVIAYWNDAKGTFENSCIQKEKYPVVIKLEKSKGDFLANLEVLEAKIEEDYIVATINMYGFQFAVDDTTDTNFAISKE